MRLTLKRALSLILCLCLLLPGFALAEKDVSGVRFALEAHMDPSAYPESDQALLRGIADLLDVITLTGTREVAYNDYLDINADLLLEGAEETRTALRLFGTRAIWGIESSLLGDELLTINLGGLLEFAMKAYFHLNLPLQYLCLLISPTVHTNAFDSLYPLWQEVMLADTASRVIPREDVLALADRLSSAAEGSRAFTYWVKAVALAAGYDETLQNTAAALPEWADSFLGDDGITITAEKGRETWRTGDATLFSRVDDGSLSVWTLTLPPTPEGYTLSAACTVTGGDINLQVTIANPDADETVLDARITSKNLPLALPIAAPFSLAIDLTGEAAGAGTHLRFAGEGEGTAFSLRQLDAASGQTMLTVSGTLEPYEPATAPCFAMSKIGGTELISLNDMTLSELMRNIQSPLLHGMLPILLHVPASSFQSLLDMLTDSGILSLLTSDNAGIAEGEGEDAGGWDENSWSGEEDDYYGYADEEAAWDESDESSGDADWDYYAAADEPAEDEADEE